MITTIKTIILEIVNAVCLKRPRYAVNYAASSSRTLEAVKRDTELEAVVAQWRQDRHQHDTEIARWKHLPADQCPMAVIVDIEDRQIGGLNVHREQGTRREDVPRIYIGALSDDEVADYVAASYRYADYRGMTPAEVAVHFRRLLSKLGGDSWAIRQRIGPEREPFDYACRPGWARRLRWAWSGIGCWDHTAPSKPIARVLAGLFGLPAAAMLLNDDDFDAFDFIGWVRRGWRPSWLLTGSITDEQRQQRLDRLERAGSLAASPLRRRADALWLEIYFQRKGAVFLPRRTPASRTELRGLL